MDLAFLEETKFCLPARRETELGFLQKGQIHLKIPPKTASDTKT